MAVPYMGVGWPAMKVLFHDELAKKKTSAVASLFSSAFWATKAEHQDTTWNFVLSKNSHVANGAEKVGRSKPSTKTKKTTLWFWGFWGSEQLLI